MMPIQNQAFKGCRKQHWLNCPSPQLLAWIHADDLLYICFDKYLCRQMRNQYLLYVCSLTPQQSIERRQKRLSVISQTTMTHAALSSWWSSMAQEPWKLKWMIIQKKLKPTSIKSFSLPMLFLWAGNHQQLYYLAWFPFCFGPTILRQKKELLPGTASGSRG